MSQIALTGSDEVTPIPESGKDGAPDGKIVYHKGLFEVFGLTRASDAANPRHNEALSKIWDYAKTVAENKDPESIKMEILKLKHRLGSGGMENTPYLKVEMFVTAWRQARQAEDRMRELEHRD